METEPEPRSSTEPNTSCPALSESPARVLTCSVCGRKTDGTDDTEAAELGGLLTLHHSNEAAFLGDRRTNNTNDDTEANFTRRSGVPQAGSDPHTQLGHNTHKHAIKALCND
ncbi:hypothetical protein FQA47_018623 [Oryzias melastigma]|uniref:Uncharacterized protein n=1 Tax=Oryzias melastigma TaxID=30732 RepID=A0A834F3C7_ORYME|nr:hypothetical protein FQA47_018623 [Oryzias melastigma]